MTARSASFLLAAVAAAALAAASGCSAKKGGPYTLAPGRPPAGEYKADGAAMVYAAGPLRVSVEHAAAESDKAASTNELAGTLGKNGYVLLRMEIRNDSPDLKVIYNPSMTSLRGDGMGYRKPLDYTDLYDAARALKAEAALKRWGREFYDSNVTVAPGSGTSRLLAFKALPDDTSSAALSIRELYVGTETVDLLFPFKLKPAPASRPTLQSP